MEKVFVCKLFTNGNSQPMYLTDPVLGNRNSTVFKEAIEYAKNKAVRTLTSDDCINGITWAELFGDAVRHFVRDARKREISLTTIVVRENAEILSNVLVDFNDVCVFNPENTFEQYLTALNNQLGKDIHPEFAKLTYQVLFNDIDPNTKINTSSSHLVKKYGSVLATATPTTDGGYDIELDGPLKEQEPTGVRAVHHNLVVKSDGCDEHYAMMNDENNYRLSQAIGVLRYTEPTVVDDYTSTTTHTTCFIFIYPNESVYITDCYGNTVDSLRRY